MERTCGIRIGAGRVAGVSTRKDKMMDAEDFVIFFFSTPLLLAISRRKVKAIYAAGASSLTAAVVAAAEGCVAPSWCWAHWGGP